MRFMKTGILALTALMAFSSPIATAQASEATLVKFLEAIEESWDGNGANRQMPGDGRRIETPFQLTVKVRYVGNDNWQVTNTRRNATGWTEKNVFYFGVRGDRLKVGPVTPNELVEIIETTDTALAYRIYRYDPRTGQTIRYTYDTRLVRGSPNRDGTPGPLYLDGLNTIEANGRVVSEDQFALQLSEN